MGSYLSKPVVHELCTSARDRVLLTRCERSQIFTKNILHVTVPLARPVRLTYTVYRHAYRKPSNTHTCIAEAMIGASRSPARAADAMTSAICAHTAPPSRLLATLASMPLTTNTACEHEAGKHAGGCHC